MERRFASIPPACCFCRRRRSQTEGGPPSSVTAATVRPRPRSLISPREIKWKRKWRGLSSPGAGGGGVYLRSRRSNRPQLPRARRRRRSERLNPSGTENGHGAFPNGPFRNGRRASGGASRPELSGSEKGDKGAIGIVTRQNSANGLGGNRRMTQLPNAMKLFPSQFQGRTMDSKVILGRN